MIKWLTEYLGTGAFDSVPVSDKYEIIDVRDLVDKSGNEKSSINEKIVKIINLLKVKKKIVVCCDYGMSRSNSIAVGVISLYDNIGFDDALNIVIKATGERSIKLDVLSVVRDVVGGKIIKDKATAQNNILVTGSSGFIGKALIPKINRDNSVFSISSKDIDLQKSISELDILVRKNDIKTLVHLANPRIYTTNESMTASLLMLKNILDVCKSNQTKLVYLSGWEIYSGYKSKNLLASEILQPLPKGTYGETKYLSEILINQYQQMYDLKALILRSSPVYGLGSDKPKFIHNFIKKAFHDIDIITHRYLNGFPFLDLIHIEDLSEIVTIAINKKLNGTYNVGTGILTSTTQVAETIIDLSNSKSKIFHTDITDYASNIAMDMSSINKHINYTPNIKMKSGIQELIYNYRNKGENNG